MSMTAMKNATENESLVKKKLDETESRGGL
jgi:hypothetical protein